MKYRHTTTRNSSVLFFDSYKTIFTADISLALNSKQASVISFKISSKILTDFIHRKISCQQDVGYY